MAAPTTRVFISYAHRYREWASALHDNLELCAEGAPRSLGVFLDERDLESGSSWVGQLEARLDRADHLVLTCPELLGPGLSPPGPEVYHFVYHSQARDDESER